MSDSMIYVWLTIAVVLIALIALRMLKARKNKSEPGRVHMDLGWEYECNGKHDDALEEYRAAEKEFRTSKNIVELAKSIFLQALSLKRFNKLDEAEERFFSSMELCRALKDDDSLAHACAKLAELYRDNKKYDDAEAYFAKAAGLWENLYKDRNQAFAVYHLGITEAAQNKTEQAILHIEQALKIFRIKTNNDQLVLALVEAAEVFEKLGNNRGAVELLSESGKIYKKMRDKSGEERVLAALEKLGKH